MMDEVYVFTSEKENTEVESGEFDDLGPVPEMIEGYHSLFAAQVVGRPTKEEIEPEEALANLRRQVRFIASLHQPAGWDPWPNSSLRTFELRFIKGEDGSLQVVFLGKAFAEDEAQSRQLALELWREIECLFPRDYALRPARQEGDFAELAGQDMLGAIGSVEQVAELRRYEEFIPMEREEQVWEENYLVYPFVWHTGDWESVFRAMRASPGRHLLSVSLRPTRLYEAEERFLCDLYATSEKLSKVNWLRSKVQGQIGMELYTAYLRRLKRPFLMRIYLVGEEKVSLPVAQALGAELAGPEPGEESPYEVGYELVFPAGDEELEVAVRNLKLLEHEFWGADLPLAKYRRFRYLVDAVWANCAFRLPVIPEEGRWLLST